MSGTPRAVFEAQRLIWQKHRRTIPDYRITFTLATEPDQYRISYFEPRPNARNQLVDLSAVYRLTITPEDFEAWNAWLDNRPGGRP